MRPLRQVDLDGTIVAIADDEGSFWSRFERGSWEPGSRAVVAARVGPGSMFLDLGAWVGPMSLLAASLGARVLSVEADPAALADLRANVAANPDLSARIEIVAAAIAPAPGPVRLGAHRRPGDSMSSTRLADIAAVTWTADGITSAELANRLERDAGDLFIKIDIEGGEYDVLPTFGPLLAGRPVACLVSFHPWVLAGKDLATKTAMTAAALVPFAGLRATALGQAAERDRWPDAAAIETSDTWLFQAD